VWTYILKSKTKDFSKIQEVTHYDQL